MTFTCFDETSGIKSCVADGSAPMADQITLSTEGAGQSASGTATDNADNTNSATVGDINIDKTAPTEEEFPALSWMTCGKLWVPSVVAWSVAGHGSARPLVASEQV